MNKQHGQCREFTELRRRFNSRGNTDVKPCTYKTILRFDKMVQKIINIKLLLSNNLNFIYRNNLIIQNTRKDGNIIDTKWKESGRKKKMKSAHFYAFCPVLSN